MIIFQWLMGLALLARLMTSIAMAGYGKEPTLPAWLDKDVSYRKMAAYRAVFTVIAIGCLYFGGFWTAH